MHKVNSPGATPNGEFTDGDPAAGIARTILAARWHNSVQRELVQVVEAAGLVPSVDDDSQLLQALGVLSTPDRNLAINGGMAVWSRGVPLHENIPGGTSRFLSDRWSWHNTSGGGASQANRIQCTPALPGQDGVPRLASHYMQVWWDAHPNEPFLRTRLEGLRPFSATPLTVSFWARAAFHFLGQSLTCQVVITRFFGPGAVTFPQVVLEEEIQLGSGVFGFHELHVDLSSIAGTSPAPGELDKVGYLEIMLRFPEAVDAGIDITAFKVERAAQATPWEPRPRAIETTLCRRYFERSGQRGLFPSFPVAGCAIVREALPDGELVGLRQQFQVEKFRFPDITWYSTQSGVADRVLYGGTDRVVTSTEETSENSTGWPVLSHTDASEQIGKAHWYAEAEI